MAESALLPTLGKPRKFLRNPTADSWLDIYTPLLRIVRSSFHECADPRNAYEMRVIYASVYIGVRVTRRVDKGSLLQAAW